MALRGLSVVWRAGGAARWAAGDGSSVGVGLERRGAHGRAVRLPRPARRSPRGIARAARNDSRQLPGFADYAAAAPDPGVAAGGPGSAVLPAAPRPGGRARLHRVAGGFRALAQPRPGRDAAGRGAARPGAAPAGAGGAEPHDLAAQVADARRFVGVPARPGRQPAAPGGNAAAEREHGLHRREPDRACADGARANREVEAGCQARGRQPAHAAALDAVRGAEALERGGGRRGRAGQHDRRRGDAGARWQFPLLRQPPGVVDPAGRSGTADDGRAGDSGCATATCRAVGAPGAHQALPARARHRPGPQDGRAAQDAVRLQAHGREPQLQQCPGDSDRAAPRSRLARDRRARHDADHAAHGRGADGDEL